MGAGVGWSGGLCCQFLQQKQKPGENEAGLLGVPSSISPESDGNFTFRDHKRPFIRTGLLKGAAQIRKRRHREEKHLLQDICADRGSSEVRTQGPRPHQNLPLTCCGFRSQSCSSGSGFMGREKCPRSTQRKRAVLWLREDEASTALTGSQPRAILPPPTPARKHFWFLELGGRLLLLAPCGQRPGTLLTIPECTTKNSPAPNANSGEGVKS